MVEKPLRRVKSTCHRVYLDCGPPSTSDIWQQIELKTLAQSPPTPHSEQSDSLQKTSKQLNSSPPQPGLWHLTEPEVPPVPLWQSLAA